MRWRQGRPDAPCRLRGRRHGRPTPSSAPTSRSRPAARSSFRLQGLDRVAVSFFGDGASNIGAFHEGLNLAAVQRRAGQSSSARTISTPHRRTFRLDGAYHRHCRPCGGLRHARRSRSTAWMSRRSIAAARTAVARARAGRRSDAHRVQDLSLPRSLARRSRWLPRARRACGLDGPRSDRAAPRRLIGDFGLDAAATRRDRARRRRPGSRPRWSSPDTAPSLRRSRAWSMSSYE